MIPQQVMDFLHSCAPFDSLETDTLSDLASNILATYVTKDNAQKLLQANPGTLFLIHSGQFVVTDANGQVSHLSEGDYFGYDNATKQAAQDLQLEVDSPGIVYGLPGNVFQQYQQDYPAIAAFFQRNLSVGLQNQILNDSDSLWLHKSLADVISPQVVSVDLNCSVHRAAQTMQEHGVSSLLITHDKQLVGILTDRDLRNRVVAQNADLQQGVSAVMTADPAAIEQNRSMFDALCTMTEHNIHHLPVIDPANSSPVGMVTHTDVIKQQRGNIVFLLNELSKAANLYELTRLSWQLPHYFASHAKRIGDYDVAGKILSQATDIMTRKLLDFFHQKNGPSPFDYCWLVFGSQAREDQTTGSDQDNGLLLAEQPDDVAANYFAAMADYVCQGLGKCGIKLCNGNIMASNPELRQSVQQAIDDTKQWVSQPTKQALLKINIFLDVRAAAGNKNLLLQLQKARTELLKQPIFLAALARQSNEVSVPLSLFQKFVFEKGRKIKDSIDLKVKAVAIINDIARLYALANGLTMPGTLTRLDNLPAECELSILDAHNLRDVWLFLNRLRWRHQLRNHVTDNCISVSDLSSIEKHQLKASLKTIATAQQALLVKFSAGIS